ncbi:MAG: heavy metal sensor histidine kinase [Pseudomonadota bacterium]
MKAWSINGRLTFTFAAATAVVFLAAGLAISVFQVVELRRHQTEEVRARFHVIEALVFNADEASDWRFVAEKLSDFTPADGSLRIEVRTEDPRYNFGQAWPEQTGIPADGEGVFTGQVDGRTFLGLYGGVKAHGRRPAARIRVAADQASMRATALALGAGVLLVTLVAVALVTLLARRITRVGLLPLEALSRHAKALNPEDRGMRLPEAGLPAELVDMTGAFNGALLRLEAAYERLAAFNADVAHELRTPLGNLIGQTQVTLSRPRPGDELQDVLHSNLEELERLRSMVNDMLFLARADEGAVAENLATVSLAGLTRKTAEFLDVLFDEAGVRLTIEGDAMVTVEPALIGRALTNLLDNAIRHGTAGGEVRVSIREQPGAVCLDVRNTGTPIAPAALERLFDRFYRIDPARQRSEQSHGLGLAIVKAVAAMHRGTVFARNDGPYVLVGMQLVQAKLTQM